MPEDTVENFNGRDGVPEKGEMANLLYFSDFFTIKKKN